MNNSAPSHSFLQKTLAWAVHVFTASGMVAGFMAILAINEKDWREAMFWLILCLIIDGIDGTFARLFKVKEVLPFMDGKSIDYVVDIATYAIIPAYFFHEADLVSESWKLPATALILLVSVIYYGKDGMVSQDNYFIGFPVLWNLVVFYLVFVFLASETTNLLLIITFSILHFIPVKFAYPSRGSRFRIPTLLFSILFFAVMIAITYLYPERNGLLTTGAWLCGLYFAALAVYTTFYE